MPSRTGRWTVLDGFELLWEGLWDLQGVSRGLHGSQERPSELSWCLLNGLWTVRRSTMASERFLKRPSRA